MPAFASSGNHLSKSSIIHVSLVSRLDRSTFATMGLNFQADQRLIKLSVDTYSGSLTIARVLTQTRRFDWMLIG
jgi:hypothetical protein